jgi:hypothetical protein
MAAAALAVAGAVAVALAVAAGGDDGGETATSTSASTAPGVASSSTASTGPSVTASSRPAAGSSSTTVPEVAAAPWRREAVARSQVPAEFLEVWERATNRSTCGLLVPTVLPDMDGALAKTSDVNDDAGWNIRYRKAGAIVEVLGLFERNARPEDQKPAAFSKTWADGSVARYGPDDAGGPLGGNPDPEGSANEAVLEVTGQACAYRIYDTLGKTHLEQVFEGLRFAEGTE